jgi:amidohydrolase
MHPNLLSKNDLDKLVSIRHHLNSYPELSRKEFKTAEFISEQLEFYTNCKLIKKVGGIGVAVIFSGKTKGKKILFRRELYALPIQKKNSFCYKSKVKNVSHKCGHDGHMAILLGLAKVLNNHLIESGQIILLFQLAEEIGLGAKAVLADNKFSSLNPDYVFALHNWPGIPKKQIMYSDHIFTASVKSVIIKLTGHISHALQPEKGNNPALRVAEIMQMAKTMLILDPYNPNM